MQKTSKRIFGYVMRTSGKSNTAGLKLCKYNDPKQEADISIRHFRSRNDLINYVLNNQITLINASIYNSKDKTGKITPRIYFRQYKDTKGLIEMIAHQVRKYFEKDYGVDTDLCGYCIEASEVVSAMLKFAGINSRTVEGWCEFDDEYYGSDRPYDPHTWVEIDVKSSNRPIYVDITADQFNPGMYKENEFKGVTISIGLPHGMTYDEPAIYDDDY